MSNFMPLHKKKSEALNRRPLTPASYVKKSYVETNLTPLCVNYTRYRKKIEIGNFYLKTFHNVRKLILIEMIMQYHVRNLTNW